VVDGGLSYLAGAGQSETFVVDVTEAGTYAMTVWRVTSDTSSATDPTPFTYTLVIDRSATDVEPGRTPMLAKLLEPRPNPFNPRTELVMELAAETRVELVVFDARGRLVRSLVEGTRAAGTHRTVWDGTDDAGAPVTSGVYFVQMITDASQEVRKVALVR
jgi:hypothetical protein